MNEYQFGRYFEDFKIGLVIYTEPDQVTKKEIINFAKKYDPQQFHIMRI